MRLKLIFLSCLALLASAQIAHAQQPPPTAKPEDTEVWKPEPKVVTPGADCRGAPSDAVVLFGGTDLSEWVNVKDQSPASWAVADGVITVNKKSGNIETKRRFHNYQLHIEWLEPPDIAGTAGQLSPASPIITTVSPILTSACMMQPSGRSYRLSGSAPNTRCRNSMTAWAPAAIR